VVVPDKGDFREDQHWWV